MPRRALPRASGAPVTLKRNASAATYIAVHNPSLSLDTGRLVERSPGTCSCESAVNPQRLCRACTRSTNARDFSSSVIALYSMRANPDFVSIQTALRSNPNPVT